MNYSCSPTVMKITGGLHCLAIIVAIIGAVFQMKSIQEQKPFSVALPLALAIMMFIRLPNQICVALRESHGWFSVLGSLVALTTYLVLVVYTYDEGRKQNNSEEPSSPTNSGHSVV